MTRYIGVATDDMTSEALRSQLADSSLTSSGAARVGYDGETVESALDKAKAFPSYAELRAYRGLADVIHITNRGVEGFFSEVGSVSPIDNGGTLIVDALGRSWARIFIGAVYPQWWGAVADGVADDTAAIQSAVNAVGLAGGGLVRFPAGMYRLSAAINVASSAVRLEGDSRFSTLLMQSTLNSKIINITADFCHIGNISGSYTGTPVAGATAIDCAGSYCTAKDFIIRRSHTAISWHEGVAGKISDFELLNYESIGLLVSNLNDLFVSKFIINAGTPERGTLGGIRLINKVEAFVCTDGDVLLGQFAMTMDAASFTLGNRPAYNNFTNVFFDSAVNATQINKCIETEFVGCWFSCGRAGGGAPGASVTSSQSIRFTNTRFFNCGGSGLNVAASSSDVTLTACKAESNSVTSGPGVAHGFVFGANCTQFQVIGCTAANGLFGGTQAYGLFINTGCDQFVVSGNNLMGNATGSMLDGSSATADKTVQGNIGYRTSNNGTGTVASGTTSIVVPHGLAVAPRVQDIMLTRQGTNAGSTDMYPSNPTATSFTINLVAAPSINAPITWSARIAGS